MSSQALSEELSSEQSYGLEGSGGEEHMSGHNDLAPEASARRTTRNRKSRTTAAGNSDSDYFEDGAALSHTSGTFLLTVPAEEQFPNAANSKRIDSAISQFLVSTILV